MVMEDYVSRETYKLLKEKGYDGEFKTCYDMEGYTYPAIHLYDAMRWLRETYNIHIVPYFDKLQNSDDLPYSFTLYLVSEHCATIEKTACFDIDENYYWKYPEQACEAAIKYCVENLI